MTENASQLRLDTVNRTKTIVVKVGTNVLSTDDDQLDSVSNTATAMRSEAVDLIQRGGKPLAIKGLERAAEFTPPLSPKAHEYSTRVDMCDVFAQRNTNRTQAQQIASWPKMVEKAIADPDAAADHWEKLNPKPEPITPAGYVGSSFMDVEGDKNLEPWLQNEDRASDQAIAEVINEYRAGAVKSF